MRTFSLLPTILPLLVSSAPLPGVLFSRDNSKVLARNDNIAHSLSPVEKRLASDTANDLVNGICRAVTVIFARGTTEPGNIGLIVGPLLDDNLDAILGSSNVAFQGVDYSASIVGFLEGGDPAGTATMAALANQAATQCPQTQIVMSGYSQGAQVVSKATAQLPASTIKRINAVVLFGNPNGPNTPVPNISQAETKIYCAAGDDICAGGDLVLPPHLSYGIDTPAAAQYIATKVTV